MVKMELKSQIKNYNAAKEQAGKEIAKLHELQQALYNQKEKASDFIDDMDLAVCNMETIEWNEMSKEEQKKLNGTNSETYLDLWGEMDDMRLEICQVNELIKQSVF